MSLRIVLSWCYLAPACIRCLLHHTSHCSLLNTCKIWWSFTMSRKMLFMLYVCIKWGQWGKWVTILLEPFMLNVSFCLNLFISSSCKTSKVENGAISCDGHQQPADRGRVVLGRHLQVRRWKCNLPAQHALLQQFYPHTIICVTAFAERKWTRSCETLLTAPLWCGTPPVSWRASTRSHWGKSVLSVPTSPGSSALSEPRCFGMDSLRKCSSVTCSVCASHPSPPAGKAGITGWSRFTTGRAAMASRSLSPSRPWWSSSITTATSHSPNTTPHWTPSYYTPSPSTSRYGGAVSVLHFLNPSL